MADNKKMVEAITSMDTDFAQWYTDVVKKAELCDYASVKGCMVIKPAGYAIWENIQKELDRRFKETGVQNVYMPIFIPESLLEKEKDVNKIMQFNEEMEALGVTHRTEVKKCAVENASPEIASALQLRDGKAIALQRLRFADGEPLVFEFTYIPYRLFRGIENLNFAKVSLYENMKKEYGLYVARTEKSVRAIAATAEIAEMLGTKEGAPILRIVTKGFSVENLPLEYSIAYYLSERYNMRLDVVSPDFKGCINQ